MLLLNFISFLSTSGKVLSVPYGSKLIRKKLFPFLPESVVN